MCTLRGQGQYFLNYDVFMFLNVVLTLAKGASTDETQHYAAFHLGLHCLPKYQFGVFLYTNGKYIFNYITLNSDLIIET